MTGNTGRSAGLDLLRVVACAMVVVHHLGTTGSVDALGGTPLHLNTGVFVFFALSGYLLFKPFVRGSADLQSYGIKRAARILPGYYVALLALTVLTPAAPSLTSPLPFLTITSSYDIPLRDFLGVSWTLSAEIVFYVTLPFLARISRGRELTVLGWLAIASFGGYFVYLTQLNAANQWLVGSFPLVFYQFVPGMLIATLQVRRPNAFSQLARWPTLLLGIGLIVLGALPNPILVDWASSVGAALAIPWLASRQWRGASVLTFLGGMSYAMYLWHLDLLQAFGVIGLPIALVGSAASWALIERPILDWAHRVSRRTPRGPEHAVVPVAAASGLSEP